MKYGVIPRSEWRPGEEGDRTFHGADRPSQGCKRQVDANEFSLNLTLTHIHLLHQSTLRPFTLSVRQEGQTLEGFRTQFLFKYHTEMRVEDFIPRAYNFYYIQNSINTGMGRIWKEKFFCGYLELGQASIQFTTIINRKEKHCRTHVVHIIENASKIQNPWQTLL